MQSAERRAFPAKMGFALLLSAFCTLNSAFSQEDAELPPPPKRPGVQITFIPPPLTGTLSLGIYNKAGKLVRTLHREARTKEFVVGLNGLITWWDGKTDAGAVAPVGNYSVRGYAVGAVEFQGEAFHFNDWVGDDGTPRIRRINAIGGLLNSIPEVTDLYVKLADGKSGGLHIDANLKTSNFWPGDPPNLSTESDVNILGSVNKMQYGIQAGKLLSRESDGWKPVGISPTENVIDCIAVTEETGIGWWIIDRIADATEIKRFAADGTFVRSLAIPADQPQPFGMSIDANDMLLMLLEEKDGIQRVRTLERRKSEAPDNAGPESPKVSEWAVTMSKTIRASDNLVDIQADLKTEAGVPFAAVEKINVRLLPNQLVQNKITSVDVAVAVDAKGSFLRTADGLPLKRITETPGLKWVAMMREPDGGKAVTIFQSDGAVVEEFKAKKLANMMAFDAGNYEWAGR